MSGSLQIPAFFLCVFSVLACSTSHQQIPSSIIGCVPSAHRGEHSTSPDNSYGAISSAVRERIPFIEIDVRSTADGGLIIFHDKKISSENSIADTKLHGRTISSLSNEELARVRNPDTSSLLRLSDALEIVSGSDSSLQLDVKPDSASTLELVVESIQLAPKSSRNIIIQCQHLECVRHLQRIAPNIRVLARAFSMEDFRNALSLRPHIIQVDEEVLTLGVIKDAHAATSSILVKTLGTPPDSFESWSRLCSKGVDIILTDHPLELATLSHTAEADSKKE